MALFFEEQKDAAFADTEVLFHETTDNDHGRLEVRRHWSCSHIAWLKERHPWPGLASIGMIEAETEENGKTTTFLYRVPTRRRGLAGPCRPRPLGH